MPIPASEPTRLDRIYDQWAISSLVMRGDGLVSYDQTIVRPITVEISMVKYCIRPDGMPERSPLANVPGSSDTAPVTHPDLLALMAERPDVADAVNRLTAALAAYATDQGLL
jgi:hypothetical protein